jgi:hypothetical protein
VTLEPWSGVGGRAPLPVHPAFLRRALALASVALLAAIGALALAEERADRDEPAGALPVPIAAPGGGWYDALAAPPVQPQTPRRTACGYQLRPKSIGVAHPVLPCGTKLYLAFRDREALTQVIAVGPSVAGRQFTLTNALAKALGVQGTQTIRWRYAR